MTTEHSDTLSFVASHCETTAKSNGAVTEATVVNWSGMVAAIALLVGAWLAGAVAVGLVDRRRATIGMAAAVLLVLGAAAVFFI